MDTAWEILKRKADYRVWSINPGDFVSRAIERMVEKNVGSLLVINGSEVVGIISERDIIRNMANKGLNQYNTPVEQVMESPVVCVNRDTSIEECHRLMLIKRLSHLPVVDRDQLLGLISIGDTVHYLLDAQDFQIEELIRYITNSTAAGDHKGFAVRQHPHLKAVH